MTSLEHDFLRWLRNMVPPGFKGDGFPTRSNVARNQASHSIQTEGAALRDYAFGRGLPSVRRGDFASIGLAGETARSFVMIPGRWFNR